MINFFKAIRTLFDATPHNGFYTALGGRFSYGEATQEQDFPYAVYFGLPLVNQDTFSGTIDDGSFQINIYSEKNSATESLQLTTLCLSLFDGVTISATGYKDIILIREMVTPPWKDGDNWVSSIEFSTLIQEE